MALSFNDYIDLSYLESSEQNSMESSLFSDISISNRSGSGVSPFEDFDHSRFQDLEAHSHGPAQDQALVNHNGKRPCPADNHTKDTNNTNNTAIINNNFNNNSGSSLSTDAARPPVNIVSNNFDLNDFDFLDAVPNFKWDWPEGDMSWDVAPPKQKIEALAQPLDVEYTPELSPAMSLCTPSMELIDTPYPFDTAAFDEINASPSSWNSPCSPYEESFASDFSTPNSQQVSNSFDFDFSVEDGNGTAWQYDFQLFPDQSETAKLKSLMESHPNEDQVALTLAPQDSIIDSSSPIYELKQSPVELKLDSFAKASPVMSTFPGTFTVAKILGQDVQAPGVRVAPRKITQSPTKPGFQPAAKKRRRRVTSEESSRVVPADDPNGKARFQCSECDKTFSRPFNLRSHRATHAGVKPHSCTHINPKGVQCHWTFARRHDLERHVRSRHSTEKMFTCRTCGARCGRNDAFKRHLARNTACTQGALDDDQDMDQGRKMDQLTTLYQTIQRDIDALDQDRQALDNYVIDHVDEKDADSVTSQSSTGSASPAPVQSLLSQAFPGQLRSPPATPSFSLSTSVIPPFDTQDKSLGSQLTKDDNPYHSHPLLERLWAQSKNSLSAFRSLVLQERSNLQSRRDRLIENQGAFLKTMVDLSMRLEELAKDERIRGLELAKEERLRGREIEMEIRLRELQKEEKIRLREIEKEERVRLQALGVNTAIKGNIGTTVSSNNSTSTSTNTSTINTNNTGNNSINNVNAMGSGHENNNGESSSKVGLPLASAERAALGEQSAPKPAWLVAIEAKEAVAAAAASSSGTGSDMTSSGEVRSVDSTASSDGERRPKSYLAKEQAASTEATSTIGVAAPDTVSNVRTSSKKSREGVRAGYANRVDAIINNIR